jgi:hypothetical protein
MKSPFSRIRSLLTLAIPFVLTLPGTTGCEGPEPPPSDPSAEAASTHQFRAIGTFEVTITPLESEGESEVAPTLGRASLTKRFHGDIEGTAEGTMLTALTPIEGSAGYVALERVTGTLQGRRGSFVLQHHGLMDREARSLTITVVPDSGTGELEGIRGTMTIGMEDGTRTWELVYMLP